MRSKRFFVPTLATLLAALMFTPAAFGQESNGGRGQPETDSSALETQAYLGLGVGPLHPTLAAQLPEVTGKGRGVLVEHVMKESPAAKAGLKQHDVLISYDKQELYSPEQLVKLVRNDEPGREVSLSYVRAGQVRETTLTLGEVPLRDPVRRTVRRIPPDQRPELRGRAEQRQRMERRERERQNDPRPWATFKSLTITKTDDGLYKVEIDFRDKDEKLLHREYVGSREEIRQAIEEDKALPDAERKHLLRSLDQQAPAAALRFQWPRRWGEFFDFDRELFNWPNLDF